MRPRSIKTFLFIFATLCVASNMICGAALQVTPPEGKEKLAVLPFMIDGLPPDQSRLLQQRFEERLRESQHFELLPDHLLRIALTEAGLERTDSCVSLPCLAQLGKVLNVQKIVHVRGMHAGQRYIVQIRLADVSDAKLLYDETINSTGEFNHLLAAAFSEQAGKIDKTFISTDTPWYYYASAVLVGAGLIYWLFSTWASTNSSESGTSPSTPTTQ
jgi:hypothetical protein